MTTAPEERDNQLWAGFQQKMRRGFFIGTIGYVIVVLVILWTLWALAGNVRRAEQEYEGVNRQLASARQDLAAAQSQLAAAQSQYNVLLKQKEEADAAIAASQAQIQDLEAKLRQIYDFKPHIVPVTEVDEKMAYGAAGPKGFQILQAALEDARRKLPFSGANNPTAGFLSPAYAQYLLGKVGITEPIASLPQRHGAPENGDIITYPGFYHMFYFKIPELHKEFVIGMTPEGVLSLDPNFSRMQTVYAVLKR